MYGYEYTGQDPNVRGRKHEGERRQALAGPGLTQIAPQK